MSADDPKTDDGPRPADQAPNTAIPSTDPAEGSEDVDPRQPGSPRG